MPADQPDADLAASGSDSRLRVDRSGSAQWNGTRSFTLSRPIDAVIGQSPPTRTHEALSAIISAQIDCF